MASLGWKGLRTSSHSSLFDELASTKKRTVVVLFIQIIRASHVSLGIRHKN
jgi:hypothetical protein